MPALTTPEPRVRLHITPLTPALLPTIIPANVLEQAANISFHTVQSFPEKGFGYVDLPAMAAENLKKKFNGAILKGEKIRIQHARPEKRKKHEDADADADATDAAHAKREKKKRKITDKVEEGVELPAGRKVKRGWTESGALKKEKRAKDKGEKKPSKKKKEKKREGSKYTNGPEMLFRTKLTPTAATDDAMKERVKRTGDKKRKSSSKKVVVHEFEHTDKFPSFLEHTDVAANSAPVAGYVDGEGWVDTAGSVVEAESKKKRKRKSERIQQDGQTSSPATEMTAENTAISSSGERDADSTKDKSKKKKKDKPASVEADPVSKKIHPAESAQPPQQPDVEQAKPKKNKKKRQKRSPTAVDATETDPGLIDEQTSETVDAASQPKAMHPLEALFKSSKPAPASSPTTSSPNKPAPIDTSRTGFSFFGAEDDHDDGDVPDAVEGHDANPPLTPFTHKDMHHHALRSAAPPPDTPSGRSRRVFNFNGGGLDPTEEGDRDEEDRHADGETLDDVVAEGKEETEFSKDFFERRSENNKLWRQKRRDVLKKMRQGENRRLSRAAV